MNRKEAINAVSNAVENTYKKKALDITIEHYTVSIPATLSNVSLDIEAVVDNAFSQPNETPVFNTLPYLTLDESAIKEAIQAFTVHFDSDFTESSYKLIGTRPSLIADEVADVGQKLLLYAGTPGYSVELDALYQEILSCYNRGIFTLEFPLIKKYPAKL